MMSGFNRTWNRLRRYASTQTAHTKAVRPVSPPKFHQTAAEVHEETRRSLQLAKERLASIGDGSSRKPLDTFAQMENDLMTKSNVLSYYQYVSADAELRQASKEAEQQFSDFSIEIYKKEDVYHQLDRLNGVDEKNQRFLDKVLGDFKRNGLGLGLSLDDKLQLESLEKQLASLSITYNSNIGNDTSYQEFTKQELDGVPESVLESYQLTDSGKYKVTYKAPDLQPVLKNCNVEETRKKMWLGHENLVPENGAIFKQALDIRQKIAQILGHKNHAEYILSDRMAQSPETVRAFLVDLVEKSKPFGAKELEQFEKIKGGKVLPWDSAWCSNKIVERDFSLDNEAVKDFFTTDHTIKKMFGIFETVMGLSFSEVNLSAEQKWHEDVTCYAIHQGDTFKGYLYLDMYPRENKYNHFANFSLIPGHVDPATGEKHYPVSSLVCNFPSSGLLYHQDVVTFFHELGHGIHATLGLTAFSRFSGTNVARDFVETPSQLLEYWTWDRDQLRSLSRHKTTGQPLPDDLLDRIVRSKQANVGTFVLRQLFFGLFDLEAHTQPNFDPAKAWAELRESVIGISCPENHNGYNHFAHLMGGYDSGYYGYMWSLVFAADIWHTLFAANPMDSSVGARYVDTILSKGGSVDEMSMLKQLLGREPNNKAFRHELGL